MNIKQNRWWYDRDQDKREKERMNLWKWWKWKRRNWGIARLKKTREKK